MIKTFLKEFNKEAIITHKMLERVPIDKYNWQPHPKSMTIKQLATHIAELSTWVPMAFDTDGLDFEQNPYSPDDINNNEELLNYFEQNIIAAREYLIPENEAVLDNHWILRNGEYIIDEMTKAEVIRIVLNQGTHHRAQLGVYLRLLNIPLPATYGPSADEQ